MAKHQKIRIKFVSYTFDRFDSANVSNPNPSISKRLKFVPRFFAHKIGHNIAQIRNKPTIVWRVIRCVISWFEGRKSRQEKGTIIYERGQLITRNIPLSSLFGMYVRLVRARWLIILHPLPFRAVSSRSSPLGEARRSEEATRSLNGNRLQRGRKITSIDTIGRPDDLTTLSRNFDRILASA